MSETATSKYVAKVFRAFKPGKPLTATQRASGLFDEEPRIGHRRLKRGVTLFFTAKEMEVNKVRLRLLEKAGAIVIEPIDTAVEVFEAQQAASRGGQLPEDETLPPVSPGQMPAPEEDFEPLASPQEHGAGTMEATMEEPVLDPQATSTVPPAPEPATEVAPAPETTPEPDAAKVEEPAVGKRGRRKKE